MQPLNIAIIGTRGIPNHYGGFEQVAQYLSEGLVQKGHRVTVYNSSNHPYKQATWNGVEIIHCYDGEQFIGTAGQFIYDLNCIRNARKKDFDVILFLGYTSSSVWGRLFPSRAVIISNMDGMEWKRSKYKGPVKRFLRYAEKLAVKHSDQLVADSTAVQQYLDARYQLRSSYIPYGAVIHEGANEAALQTYGLLKQGYYMLMARMEPENNIEMILDGFCKTSSTDRFIVVGNTANDFGKKMAAKYRDDDRVHFTGAIFNQETIHALRQYCKIYFHGHSVGGTNPSLLEAMASEALIAAHDNEFNRAVLQEDALYFNHADEVMQIINTGAVLNGAAMQQNNLTKIKEQYNWAAIVDAYETTMIKCLKTK